MDQENKGVKKGNMLEDISREQASKQREPSGGSLPQKTVLPHLR